MTTAVNDVLNEEIVTLKRSLEERINQVVEVIKFQYDWENVNFKMDSKCVESNITDLQYKIFLISNRYDTNNNNNNNIITININPFQFVESESPLIKMINKHVWVLFFSEFEIFIKSMSKHNNNIITLQDNNNYVCKQFFKKLNLHDEVVVGGVDGSGGAGC